MNHRHEIAPSAGSRSPRSASSPTSAPRTSSSSARREAIAEEKGDLLASLPAQGTAVVGRDEPLAFAPGPPHAGARRSPSVAIAGADVRASRVRFLDEGACAFDFESPFGRREMRVAGPRGDAWSELARRGGGALAAGATLEPSRRASRASGRPAGGCSRECSAAGSSRSTTPTTRIPQSMRSALETLARLEQKGRRLAVLGEMGELGEHGGDAHLELGRLAAALGIDELFVLGRGRGEGGDGAPRRRAWPRERVHFEETAAGPRRADREPCARRATACCSRARARRGSNKSIEALEEGV